MFRYTYCVPSILPRSTHYAYALLQMIYHKIEKPRWIGRLFQKPNKLKLWESWPLVAANCLKKWCLAFIHVQKCWMIGNPLNNCVQQSKKRRKLLATHNYSGKFARDLPSSSCCYSKSLHSLIHPVSYLWQVSFVPLKVLIKSYAHFDKWKQILKMKAHFENESTFRE